MLETLKKTAAETFVRWAEQIDKNGGSFEINMATEFSDILARNIVHICFGEDLSEEVLKLQVVRDGKWVTEEFTLKDSTYQIVTQVIQNFYKQVSHPINWLYPQTERLFTVTSDSAKVKENCQAARNWIKSYIN